MEEFIQGRLIQGRLSLNKAYYYYFWIKVWRAITFLRTVKFSFILLYVVGVH